MSDTGDKKTGLELLREPFPDNQINWKPQGTKAQNECPANEKVNCKICGGWHHPGVVHLAYVGHAALTDRLLDADSLWTWEPLAYNEGLPAFDASGGLWIKLTVCGHSRIGYGHAPASNYKEIGSREKEVIGDALRNAAMRFGAALDLWHKGDLHVPEDETGTTTGKAEEKLKPAQAPAQENKTSTNANPEISKAHTSLYMELADACGGDEAAMNAKLRELTSFKGNDGKEACMTLAALKSGKPSDAWVGTTLGKLRKAAVGKG